MATHLRDLRRRLDTVVGCPDNCCAKGLTDTIDPYHPPDDIPALREVLASDEPASVRGLAAVMLRGVWDLDLVRVADGCVDSTEPAGDVPENRGPPQGFVPCEAGESPAQRIAVDWTRPTLGALCLDLAWAVSGRKRSLDEYHAWRARYPEPRDSLLMWQDVLGRSSPADDRVLSALERHSRKLYVRVLLTHPDGLESLGVSPKVVGAHMAGAVEPATLVDLLERPAPWPELADARRRSTYIDNVLAGWHELFGPALAPRLEALYDRGFLADEPRQRALLARAVAEALPARRREILTAVLDLPPTTGSASVLELLASQYAADEPKLLLKWFGLKRSEDVPDYVVAECQLKILAGLARATPPERALFHSLVRVLGPGDDPYVVEAALETARALGCRPPAARCDRIIARYAKGKGEEADAERARAARARADCVAALRACPVP